MIGYMFGLFSGLALSVLAGYIAWPIYVQSKRDSGESWDAACKRELERLDKLAEREEIPDTQRSPDLSDRSVN